MQVASQHKAGSQLETKALNFAITVNLCKSRKSARRARVLSVKLINGADQENHQLPQFYCCVREDLEMKHEYLLVLLDPAKPSSAWENILVCTTHISSDNLPGTDWPKLIRSLRNLANLLELSYVHRKIMISWGSHVRLTPTPIIESFISGDLHNLRCKYLPFVTPEFSKKTWCNELTDRCTTRLIFHLMCVMSLKVGDGWRIGKYVNWRAERLPQGSDYIQRRPTNYRYYP